MATIQKQVRMVFDLNKCLGCHACSMGCKTQWTDRNPGLQYQYWNNVETQPGRGYPKSWETLGGGFTGNNQVDLGPDVHVGNLPTIQGDYGSAWEYNYDSVLKTGGGDATSSRLAPSPAPDGAGAYASNWDEDRGEGDMPNNYYFYLPRMCNHCTNPACVAACPRQSIYKREEDGIVLVDQNRCRGYRYCVKGCPYKKTYFNPTDKVSQKCILCYPRRTDKLQPTDPQPDLAATFMAPFCHTQCVGRIRFIGYSTNPAANVNKLVNVWKVGLRLHPEFGTEPNLFYVPPLSPPTFAANGAATTTPRIPVAYLASLFGDNASQTQKERVARVQQVLDTIAAERTKVAAGGTSELISILTAPTEADRLQLHLG